MAEENVRVSTTEPEKKQKEDILLKTLAILISARDYLFIHLLGLKDIILKPLNSLFRGFHVQRTTKTTNTVKVVVGRSRHANHGSDSVFITKSVTTSHASTSDSASIPNTYSAESTLITNYAPPVRGYPMGSAPITDSRTPLVHGSDAESDIVRSIRDTCPAHYMLKIDSFSSLLEMLEATKAKSYESEIFEAGGYKWKLSLYPHGDKARNGTGHVSLYLIIQETSALPVGWEINVDYNFFVFDQIHDKYLTIKDGYGKVKRYHEMKKEWGIAKLLPHSNFNDAARGYLVRDSCTFGVEIFVSNPTGRGECLALPEKLTLPCIHKWKIVGYSTLNNKSCYSDIFTVGNCKWIIDHYPKGEYGPEGKSLAFYLRLADLESTPRVYAEFTLCILNQKNGKHREHADKFWFSASTIRWGRNDFMSQNDIDDASKGFLLQDTLVVQVKITRILTCEKFSL